MRTKEANKRSKTEQEYLKHTGLILESWRDDGEYLISKQAEVLANGSDFMEARCRNVLDSRSIPVNL
jgi:hypothetical protein